MAATGKMLEFIWVCFILISPVSLSLGSIHENRKLYIVYMGSLPGGSYSPTSHHLNILRSVLVDKSLMLQVLHRSYHRSFNGFAAWLTEEEQEKLSDMDGVNSVFPNPTLQLYTTRSWDFMGLTDNIKRNPTIESDMIIGMLDTGVWPESESFDDAGLGPVPKKWKGTCDGGTNFTCNRKIIGARTYGWIKSARDEVGHGTHTASTAAGSKVKGVSYYGLAEGTARGGVPSARIAVYQICTELGCDGASILAGFDDAIADGVDVISASLGNNNPVSILQDTISVGSFHAIAKNILFVNAAGNSGHLGMSTIYSLAPWIFTVGASTTDRKIIDTAILGDGRTITGTSINRFSLGSDPKYPLIYGEKFNSSCDEREIKACSYRCLTDPIWKGKILMCNDPQVKNIDADISAAGLIIRSDGDNSYMPEIPALVLNTLTFDQVVKYADTKEYDSSPRATILKSEDGKDNLAPKVISFSSKGPNNQFPNIMKPDVVAPGVDILAAYPPGLAPDDGQSGKEPVKYFFLSGTSMACPHVAGAAAYIKSKHLNWSPAAIKSALMTTAWPLKASSHPYKEFSYGSGHIDPVKATDPGLIYDISIEDYTNLLCSTYDAQTCQKIAGADCGCPKAKASSLDFNYPSLTAFANTSLNINVNFTRVVTNVGLPNSTYKATLTGDPALKISVVPSSLTFTSLNEKKSFMVSVTGAFSEVRSILSSALVWSDGIHSVRSPIVIYSY